MPQDTNYDDFAEAYSRENETSLINAYYERPATLALAGDVQGRQILEIGCGSGPLTSALISRGANVTGFDLSAAMIDLARQRLGDTAQLHVANLAEPLNFEDDSFDDAIASLVFHYLGNWDAPLKEVRRVLKPGGRLIMSVNHPLLFPMNHPGNGYFEPTKYSDQVTFNGQEETLTYWHHPLHAMADAFDKAGFQIEVISEPPFSSDAPAEIIPPQLVGKSAFLSFIFFVLRAKG